MAMTAPLNQLTATDIMTSDVLTAYEGWSIKRLTSFFIKHHISGAPVISSDHQLVGVVSITDILRFDNLTPEDKAILVAEHVYTECIGQTLIPEDIMKLVDHAGENCTVNSIMTPHVISIERHESLFDIARLMCEKNIRRVFVTEGNVICGIVSSGDILAKLIEFDE